MIYIDEVLINEIAILIVRSMSAEELENAVFGVDGDELRTGRHLETCLYQASCIIVATDPEFRAYTI